MGKNKLGAKKNPKVIPTPVVVPPFAKPNNTKEPSFSFDGPLDIPLCGHCHHLKLLFDLGMSEIKANKSASLPDFHLTLAELRRIIVTMGDCCYAVFDERSNSDSRSDDSSTGHFDPNVGNLNDNNAQEKGKGKNVDGLREALLGKQ